MFAAATRPLTRHTPHTTRSHALVLFCAPLLVSPQAVEEEDIYDDLNEDEYQELVKKRREDNFIEDDDGNGYVDFGQDDWDYAEYSGDEEEMRKRAKGEGGEARKKGVFNNLAPKKKKVRACCCVRLRACCLRPHVHAPPNHLTLHPPSPAQATERVNGMFLGAGRDVLGPGRVGGGKTGVQDTGGDELLSNLLGEIEANPMSIGAAPKRNPFQGKRSAAADAVSSARPAMPNYRPNSSVPGGGRGGSQSYNASNDANMDYTRAPPRMNMADFLEEGDMPPPQQEPVTMSIGGPAGGDAMETSPTTGGFVPGQSEVMEEEEGVSSGGAGNMPHVPFQKEEEKGAGLDWFRVVDENDGGSQGNSQDQATAQAASAVPAVGSVGGAGQLPPLEEDGTLSFFWIDAMRTTSTRPAPSTSRKVRTRMAASRRAASA